MRAFLISVYGAAKKLSSGAWLMLAEGHLTEHGSQPCCNAATSRCCDFATHRAPANSRELATGRKACKSDAEERKRMGKCRKNLRETPLNTWPSPGWRGFAPVSATEGVQLPQKQSMNSTI
jgi:hypothetical protein